MADVPTLVMFPVLIYFYRRLAINEEREVRGRFGDDWDRYADGLPRFVPHRRRTGNPLTPPHRSRKRATSPGR